MEEIVAGMPVADADGLLGTVETIQRNDAGTVTQIVVRRRSSVGIFVADTYAVVDGVLWLDIRDEAQATGTTDRSGVSAPGAVEQSGGTTQAINVAPGEQLRIPVIREDVVVQKRLTERGGVRVHKTVTTHEKVIEQPTIHQDVVVERVPIGRVVDVAPQARQEGDTLILPVLEETMTVQTRLVLTEEVRITRQRTRTSEQTRVVLREEQVHIEDLDDPSVV